MKVFRKISLIIALLFFALSAVVVGIDVSSNYHIIVGNINSNQILSILSSTAIVFFICYLVLSDGKKLYIWICTILLSFTAMTSVFIGFMPNYRYTEFVSEDKEHTLIVEEKTTSSSIYIRVYEKINYYIYNSDYSATLSKEKFGDSYKYGDFYVAFDKNKYRVLIPLYSTTPTPIPYHKTSKTSE